MIISSVTQSSPEWKELRIGNPGASSFKRIVTTKGEISKSRTEYLYELAGEIITRKKTEHYSNKRMDDGLLYENESRTLYELTHGVVVQQVGLCYKDEQKKYHCSPDGLILEKDRGFETKDAIPKVQIVRLIKGKLPIEHYTQCQGSLMVTCLETWDYQSYCRGLPELTVRVHRDEKFIEKLEKALDEFCMELITVVKKLKSLQ
jgi:hypothetical protein